jgi:hypothetical protein
LAKHLKFRLIPQGAGIGAFSHLETKRLALLTRPALVVGHLLNPSAGAAAGGATYATWNAADQGTGMVLSNGNRTSQSATNVGGRSTGGKSTGKWYAEFTMGANSTSNALLGIANSSATLANYPGADANAWVYYGDGRKVNNNSFTAYGNSYTIGDVIQIAWDADNDRVFFGKNGTWQASGDPAAGTNAAFTGITGTLMCIWGDAGGTSPITTGNWGASAFAHTAPSGFSAWSI